MGGVIYYKLPVFFEGNAMALFTNNWNTTNMNERPHDDVNVVWTNKRTNGFVFVGRMNARGGMQMQTNKTNNESNVSNQYEKEIELLTVFFSDVTNEHELQSKLGEFNGDILSVITYLASKRHLNQENNEAKEDIKEQNKLEQVSCTHKQNKVLFDLCFNYIVKKKKVKECVNMNKIEREEVLQKADTFGVIVSEDKDNFNDQSKVHQIETQHLILENITKDQNKDTEANEDRKENEGKLKNVKNKGFGP
ncbi:hypothetical protein RFI_37904 [Reticulomyxa filosa]|uniref:Uncharacterized protein n=1 Tax=Reticulomyxa filosa TaxID=46433 RepID=X6LEL2_RETFI|nr:hypothetical protein RFI_37904 [Reticulomyxa filosa]|eukprot:ETN99566.1 hypothetical protein RFI_37904 [Reticulomyxa filosa]